MISGPHAHHDERFLTPGQKTMICALIALAAMYYLWGWHKDHVLQYWPVALFLLCPLMHLFMHGSHGKDMSSHRRDEHNELAQGLHTAHKAKKGNI